MRIQYGTTFLHDGWKAVRASDTKLTGLELAAGQQPTGGMPAVVPGTVLTTLLHNHRIKDPYFGMNNDEVPEISDPGVGPDHYTYWFYKTFDLPSLSSDQRLWLTFRGINYSAEIYLNQKLLGTVEGMFRRHVFDITWIAFPAGRSAHLAVLVRPPDPPGIPDPPHEGGQNGGKKSLPNIGESVTMRYPVGWDWTQPVADRNTGIWDQVTLQTTGRVRIEHPHVVTRVLDEGGELQDFATVSLSADLAWPDVSIQDFQGALEATATAVDSDGVPRTISFEPQKVDSSRSRVVFPDVRVMDRLLWWPNGLGDQPLYDLTIRLIGRGGSVSDEATLRFGIRELDHLEPKTYPKEGGVDSRVFRVNGQAVFLRGGNWIGTDAMLRLSKKRYMDEVRMHAEMNLNLIRVWGGGITERPEFYDACDEHGMLVVQDFWRSGEYDAQYGKSEPNALGKLFLQSADDTIKMLRNHASLFLWCGGNEIPVEPVWLNTRMGEMVKKLDGTRLFVQRSTNISGTSPDQYKDGPYVALRSHGLAKLTMIAPRDFYCPELIDSHKQRINRHFNPELGYVGMATADSVRSMMDRPDWQQLPKSADAKGEYQQVAAWGRHCFYNLQHDYLNDYGDPGSSLDCYCEQAQLVDYIEDKALYEGVTNQMWKQYAGILIWKSQTPWPALSSQLYDYYLQQTGGYYGVRRACEPLHVQLNFLTQEIWVVNASRAPLENATVSATIHPFDGKAEDLTPRSAQPVTLGPMSIAKALDRLKLPEGRLFFLKLELRNAHGHLISRNTYWLPGVVVGDEKALAVRGPQLSRLRQLKPASLTASARRASSPRGVFRLTVSLENTGTATSGPVAFSLLLQATRSDTRERVVPTWYSDNYLCIAPGDIETLVVEVAEEDLPDGDEPDLWLTGWNINDQRIWSAAGEGSDQPSW